jgi:hypothetical protein
MMNYQAWPFLRAQTRITGYRLVVAPGIFSDNPAALDALDREIATRIPADRSKPCHRWVRSGDESFLIVFRHRPAQLRDVGLPGDGLLTEDEKRQRGFELVEGLAIRCSKDLTVEPLVLDRIGDLVHDSYRKFWQQGQGYRLEFSAQVTLDELREPIRQTATSGETASAGQPSGSPVADEAEDHS